MSTALSVMTNRKLKEFTYGFYMATSCHSAGRHCLSLHVLVEQQKHTY